MISRRKPTSKKRSLRRRKQMGGDTNNVTPDATPDTSPNVTPDATPIQSESGSVLGAVTGVFGTVVDAGKTATGVVIGKATSVVDKAKDIVVDKAQNTLTTSIHLLNNPDLEIEAEHAIKESGHLAAELVQATQEPIKAGILGTVDTAKAAAQQVASSTLGIAVNTAKAIPGVGAVVVAVDDVGLVMQMGNSLLKLGAKGVETFTNVSGKAIDVINRSIKKPNISPVPLSQGGGALKIIIGERQKTLKRINKTIFDFDKPYNARKYKKTKKRH